MYRMQEDEELIKGRKEETAQTKRQTSKGMHISGIGQTVAPLTMPQAPKLLVATPIHQSPNLGCIAQKHMPVSGLDPSPRPSKLPRTDHLSSEQNAFLDASLALFHATNAVSPTFPPAAPTHDQNIHGASPLPLCTLPKLMVDSVIPRIPKPGQHQALAPGPLQQASMAVSNRPLVKPRLLQSQTLLKYKKDSVASGFRIRAPGAQPQPMRAPTMASHRPLAKPHVLQAQSLSPRIHMVNVTRGTHPTMKTASEHTDCIPIPIPRQVLSQPQPLRAPTIPSIRPLTTTSPLHSKHCRRLSTSCLPPGLFQHRSNAAESTCTGSQGFRKLSPPCNN